MKATGVTRKIDNMGRLVIPKELRRTLNLPGGAPVEIYTQGDRIVITAYKPEERR